MNSGFYDVSLSVGSSNGCYSTITHSVQVASYPETEVFVDGSLSFSYEKAELTNSISDVPVGLYIVFGENEAETITGAEPV